MIAEAAFTALGWSVAAGAWVFALATYPLVLAYAYLIRDSALAFDQSLEDLRDSWGARPVESMAA